MLLQNKINAGNENVMAAYVLRGRVQVDDAYLGG